jgi:hypothetical protein
MTEDDVRRLAKDEINKQGCSSLLLAVFWSVAMTMMLLSAFGLPPWG